MLNRFASLAMSTCVLKALPGKLDIKRHSPSILYLHTLKGASYFTSSISRMELSICSVWSQQLQLHRSRAVRQHCGQNILKRTHNFGKQFAWEMELISLVYKLHYNIRPGLGLQCVFVVFPDHTRLFLFGLKYAQ